MRQVMTNGELIDALQALIDVDSDNAKARIIDVLDYAKLFDDRGASVKYVFDGAVL